MKLKPLLLILLISFSCSREENLPSIDIIKEDEIGWNDKEYCLINYSDSEVTLELSAGIKCRGGISRKYFKHSFALELDKKYPLANLPKDDDWVLNANYIDKTFMRHKISYDIFREMNARNIASRSAFVNVSINGEYEGLYVLMEKINGKMVGLNKKDTLAMLFKDPPVFYKDKLDTQFIQDSLNYYQQKFPKKRKSDKTYYIEQFKDFMFNSDDQEFAKNISKWVDLDNVIDWHIILLFSNNGDGIMKNFYLYKVNSRTPFRFAIWDYDHSYGRDGDNEMNMMERELACNRAILFERLMNIREIGYLHKLKNRWFELRELGIISYENFDKHIKDNDKIIRKHIDKNFEKWSIDSEWYFDDNNYKQELDLMREFMKIRIPQLDEYFGSI